MRYEAVGPSRVRFLTLWAADYASLDEALARVRPAALALRARGRVWRVQEVVFAQFLFLEAADAAGVASGEPPRALTTLQNDWRAPLPGEGFAAWRERAMPDAASLRSLYRAGAGDAAPPDGAPSARRCLWLGESGRERPALESFWRGRAEPGIAPLGLPTPIFPTPPGAAAQAPATEAHRRAGGRVGRALAAGCGPRRPAHAKRGPRAPRSGLQSLPPREGSRSAATVSSPPLDLDRLTPLQALTTLAQLKREAEE